MASKVISNFRTLRLNSLEIFSLNASGLWQTVKHEDVQVTLNKSESVRLDFSRVLDENKAPKSSGDGTESKHCLFSLNLQATKIKFILVPML
jgi:hypothetical protein